MQLQGTLVLERRDMADHVDGNAGSSRFEEYAEKVIIKKVDHWITENGYYYYNYKSLDEPF